MSAPPVPSAAPAVSRAERRPSRALERVRTLDWWMIAGLTVVSVALGVALYITIHKGQLLGFGDTTSHLSIARRVLDGRQNGFRQLGVHWLPLFQTLEIPFSAIDALYYSGASGAIVSILASLVTATYLYRLVRLVGCPGSVGFMALVMLAASPSFLYIGVIPMQPATIMAASTVNIYYLTRWAMNPDSTRLLVFAGLSLTITTLAHFDTWILMPLEGLVVLAVSVVHWRSRLRTVATTLVWALAGFYGVAFFLAMNVLIFGRPDAFALGGVANGHGAGQATPPFAGIVKALAAYPWAAYDVAGPALVVVGLTGMVLYILRSRAKPVHLVALLLLYPLPFYASQALTGAEYFAPSSNMAFFVHLRYAVTIIPGLVFLAAAGIRWKAAVAAATVVVAAGAGVMLYAHTVATWIDAHSENGATFVKEIGPYARKIGDRISADPHTAVYLPIVSEYNDRFEFLTRAPLGQYIDATTSDWRVLKKRPWLAKQFGVTWLFVVDFDPQLALARRYIRATNARLCSVHKFGGTQPNLYMFTLTDRCPLGEKPGPLPIPPYAGRT